MKKLFIMLMVGLTISTAAVSCGTNEEDKTTGLVVTHTETAENLAKWNRYNQNVSVVAYKENGEIVNYYVTFDVNNETIAEKYTTDGCRVGESRGKNAEDAMKAFNPIRP